MVRAWAYGVMGMVVALWGLVMLYLGDRTSFRLWLVVLVASFASFASFLVGFGLGYFGDREVRPDRDGEGSPDDRGQE